MVMRSMTTMFRKARTRLSSKKEASIRSEAFTDPERAVDRHQIDALEKAVKARKSKAAAE